MDPNLYQQQPRFEFEVLISEGDQFLKLVQHISGTAPKSTLSFSPEKISYEGASDTRTTYFKFTLHKIKLLEYKFNIEHIELSNLGAMEYDKETKTRTIGIDYEAFVGIIKDVGKNQIWLAKPVGSNTMIVGVRGGKHNLPYEMYLIPVIDRRWKIASCTRLEPNCKTTGDSMRTQTTAAKRIKADTIVFSYAPNNLYYTTVRNGGTDLNTNYLCNDGPLSGIKATIPHGALSVRVSKDYFIKSFPKLCDITGSGVLAFYMDAEPHLVATTTGPVNVKPLEILGSVGSTGEFTLYLYDVNE